MGLQWLWITTCSVTLGSTTGAEPSTCWDPSTLLSWRLAVLLLAVKLCEVFHCKTLPGDKVYSLSRFSRPLGLRNCSLAWECLKLRTPLFPESRNSPKPASSRHFHREESQVWAAILCYIFLLIFPEKRDVFLNSLILLYCFNKDLFLRMVSSVILEEVICLNTWLLLLSWLAFEISRSLVWSPLKKAPVSSSCFNSSQLSLNPFPTVLAVSHMFMHDSLTSFRQMLPLITTNRSLQWSSWMRFMDQMERVLFKYKVLLEVLWGDDWDQEGCGAEFYFCLDTSGFNEMILPPASSFSECQWVGMCLLLGFNFLVDNRKCLDSTCSFLWRKLAHSVEALNLVLKVCRSDWSWFFQDCLPHTHCSLMSASSPRSSINIQPTHFFAVFPCDITRYLWQERSSLVITAVQCGLSKESLNL